MVQRHEQLGIFHITTNAKDKISWLTIDGVPTILIDNLLMTRTLYGGHVYAFCVLSDHMHIILSPGEKGLSKFMQSFKSHAMIEVRQVLSGRSQMKPFTGNEESTGSAAASHGSPLRGGILFDEIRWQKGFHDERIRDGNQCSNAVYYVHGNGMKHGYVSEILDWPWTSLHFEHRLDPMEIWLD